MDASQRYGDAALLAALVAVLGGVSLLVPSVVPRLAELSAEHPVIGAAAFTAAMFVATVAAPVAVLPAVPFAALILGPFPTALYSILGWSLGAIVAFLIARHVARPVLERFIPLSAVARYERLIPEDAQFWWIVLLRLVIPVDILSYAIGIVSRISLARYAAATVIGVTPFSFVFSYLGVAIVSGKFFILALATAALAIAASAWYYIAYVRHHVHR